MFHSFIIIATAIATDTVSTDQSHLARGGIAVASSRNFLFVFPRWQHRTGLTAICNCVFWLAVWSSNLSFCHTEKWIWRCLL